LIASWQLARAREITRRDLALLRRNVRGHHGTMKRVTSSTAMSFFVGMLEQESKEPLMQQIPREVVWIVSLILIEAALIDGRALRVPNWLTYHFLLAGLAFAFGFGGSDRLWWSAAGALVGLMTLLPLYAIGGMGAGDVKLMAGLGAWIGPWLVFQTFVASAVVGAGIALVMMVCSGELGKHLVMTQVIGHEIMSIRNPSLLAERAGERKPRMLLLPYGIPIAIGSIALFAWAGLLR
jgi:prepilin peptidase CpaA